MRDGQGDSQVIAVTTKRPRTSCIQASRLECLTIEQTSTEAQLGQTFEPDDRGQTQYAISGQMDLLRDSTCAQSAADCVDIGMRNELFNPSLQVYFFAECCALEGALERFAI